MRDYSINKEYPLTQEQNEIIEFMRTRGQCINAAGTGLGKTLLTCTLAVHFMTVHPDYQCIIICPNKANKAFKRELVEKLHEMVSLYTADNIERTPSRFHIFNYSSLHKFVDVIKQIKGNGGVFFIVDEAHNLQNPKSQVYQVAKDVLSLGKIRWFLTATPLKNDLEGLFWMVDLLKPGYLGNLNWFRYQYMDIELKPTMVRGRKVKIPQVKGYRNLDDLQYRVSQICVIKKIPFKLHFFYRKCEIEPDMLKEYKRCATGLTYERVNKNGSKETATREWGARLHDLQRVLDNCHENLTTIAFSNKEKDLCRLIQEKMAAKESVLIYSEYYDTIDRIEYILSHLRVKLGIKNIFRITGKEKNEVRAQVEDKLTPQTVVIVSKAGTESINLQKANNVVFYDIPFAINDVIQMVGRVARMDSKFSDMNIYFIEYTSTLDTYKRTLIQAHSTLIDSVICHDTNLPTEVLVLDANTQKEMKRKLVWKFR